MMHKQKKKKKILYCNPMQQDTIKWVYNNSESAQEDNQKTNQKPALEENGEGFECQVEGDHTHTFIRSHSQGTAWELLIRESVFGSRCLWM